MDYSAANTQLWSGIIQIGIIALVILIANIIRQKVAIVKKTMIPTAVIGGFILLLLKVTHLLELDSQFLETVTFHGIAIGFIAMSLKIPEKSQKSDANLTGLKSGAIIVGSYMIQGIIGLIISIPLALSIVPKMIPAAGILLPMGFGQGPGQANNIGSSYEAMGFAGGRSFALSIAAAGYLCACIVGLIFVNILFKRGKISQKTQDIISGSVTVETFQDEEETPISESIDRFSIQVALVLGVYIVTYLVTWGLTSGIGAISEGAAKTVNSLLWGFNFIIGSALAILVRTAMSKLRKWKVMGHQYQNNYLLSRISGLAFDVMIIAGIASIEVEDLSGLILPFIIMVIAGAVVTLLHLSITCKRAYPDYYYEGLLSMYGMMTGTISSGVLLLREVDPDMKTPAANNLVVGSSFAILLAIPQLVLISMAPKSLLMTIIVLAILVAYYFVLLSIIFFAKRKKEINE